MGAAPAKQAVYCVSDIHTDHKENWTIITKLAEQKEHLSEVAPYTSERRDGYSTLCAHMRCRQR